jgi:hypothetical protein
MPTRLKYDGLPEGAHTFTYDETPGPKGGFTIIAQPRIEKGDIVEVEDLDDPKSERARICRGHVDRGVAHIIGEKPKKESKA